MKNIWSAFIAICICVFGIANANAQTQPELKKDYSFVMEVPSVLAMGSSPAHMYVLSNTEGMVVFRTQPDTLQWLYSSTGMEQRGHEVTADIRFAYLFGDGRRLTVLEPTSVLGVYSSTVLPAKPQDAKRIDNDLFVALGNKGLGELSLNTPASVDSTVDLVAHSKLSNENITDLEGSGNQLFALSKGKKLFKFSYKDGKLNPTKEFNLSENITGIYLINNSLFGSDDEGNIYDINASGNLSKLGSIQEPVKKMEPWKDWLIIKGKSNRLWTSYKNRSPELWKKDGSAGNYFTVTKGVFWLCEYNKISRIGTSNQQLEVAAGKSIQQNFNGDLSLKKIDNQTTPYSKPILLPLELNADVPSDAVQFSYQSGDIKNAEVRGESFYWQPTSDDIGNHRVKIVATTSGGQTDSTTFNIEVKSFNAPPRFAPIRQISIPVGEKFTLPINATDPDGMNKDLVRFLGVNMPEGASIDETTGMFSWTPTARQVGDNKFRVIATDQYGAAQSVDVSIKVVDLSAQRDNSSNQ